MLEDFEKCGDQNLLKYFRIPREVCSKPTQKEDANLNAD